MLRRDSIQFFRFRQLLQKFKFAKSGAEADSMEKAHEKAFTSITRNDIKVASDHCKHRPRKCLTCKTPRKVMMQKPLFVIVPARFRAGSA
jgi:hypothetical protein